MKKHITVFVIILLNISCSSDKNKKVNNLDFHEKSRLLVLDEDKVNTLYDFSKKTSSIDELKIVLLGKARMVNGDTLKFVNFTKYFGVTEDSKRGNGELYIYSSKNTEIGHYSFGSANLIPKTLEGTKLIFSYDDNLCNAKTIINFRDSIPNKIFVNCTSNGGDLYNLIKPNN